MTARKTVDREELDRLANFLVEDVLETSDSEILAEVREDGGDPQVEAARIRALFEQSVLKINKGRLLAAQSAVRALRSSQERESTLDIREARRRLQSIFEQQTITSTLTLAARNERELSDADVLTMIRDLEDLGISVLSEKK